MANLGPVTTKEDLARMGITLQSVDALMRRTGVNGIPNWYRDHVDGPGLHLDKFDLGEDAAK